jgi:hypothetical protein
LQVQSVSTPNAAGTANVFTASNAARGAATALVTTAQPGQGGNAVVQSIEVRGDGASIQTQQWIAGAIRSTGPLGDLNLLSPQGITDVRAPSIFGSILSNGPLTGIVQTTGLRTDPITGAVSSVPATLGQLYVTGQGKGKGVTATTVQVAGLNGELVSRGDLVSQATIAGSMTGVVAAQGNLGATFTYPSGQVVRQGGLEVIGAQSGEVVALGAILGDVKADGGLQGGRLAAEGGIKGNLTIHGGLDSSSAIVSGGEIGDAVWGTLLTIDGKNQGILGADGLISFKQPVQGWVFNDVGASPGNPNAEAIDAIFSDAGKPLGLDVTRLDGAGLTLILDDLAALRVGPDGNLKGPKA